MLTEAIIIAFLVTGFQLAIPILFASLGETLMEQSGVLNIGIEGVMLIGAFVTALTTINGGSIPMAILAGIGSGVLMGMVLSLLYVRLGLDQVVTGLMFNLFTFGFTALLHGIWIGGKIGGTLENLDLPLVRDIPWLGEILGRQNAMFYFAIAMSFIVFVLLRKTWLGLYIRAVGEQPSAAESSGLDVWKLRYTAVIFGAVLTAFAGSALVLSSSGGFVPGLTSGRGFIALAVVVVARWNPLVVALVALLFGMTQGLQFLAGRIGALADIPDQVWLSLPYVAAIAVLLQSRGIMYPKAVGVPYGKATS